MKRILALILALLMLAMALVACDSSSNNNNKNDDKNNENTENPNAMAFEAGYGRTEIVLELPVDLAGDNSNRPANSLYDRLFASSTAVRSSDGVTILIVATDTEELSSSALDPIREAISKETGVPFDNIIINYSHSHFTPHFQKGQPYEALLKATVDASKKAIGDLAPCTIYTGTIETEGMTSTRRFIDKNKNGKIEIKANNEIENPVDENVYVINFAREEKKDIVLANFASHSTVSSGTNTQVSSSYYGPCREAFEKDLNEDAYLSILQGAAGNSIPKAWVESNTPGPNNNYLQFDPNFIGSDAYGAKLAEYISTCLANNMKKQESELGVRVLSRDLSIVVDNSRQADTAHAQEILNEWSANGVKGNTGKYSSLCQKYNIKNTYEAFKIVSCNAMGGYAKMEINTFAIGNIGLSATGYEMLSETGKEIFEGSPFEFNFVLGYTNNTLGYIPQEEAFAFGGYEVYSCRFVKGTAEKISAQAIKQLNKLYEAE